LKSLSTAIGVAIAALAASSVSGQAQLLDLSGGTLQASFVGQTLTGISGGPPVFPTSNVGADNGTISTWIVSDPGLDSQGLIFIYQLVNDGPDAIDEVTLTAFGFTSSHLVTGSGAYSSLAGLSFGSTPSPNGNSFVFQGETGLDTVAFQQGNLDTGATSDYLAVFTDESAFYPGYAQDEDDFSAEGPILAPVPEASTLIAGAWMLLPLAIGAARALGKKAPSKTATFRVSLSLHS
jgi:hypothetical protein